VKSAFDVADLYETIYYKTEDDLGREQEEGPEGRRRNTPDFVFVDATGKPVRAPFRIPVQHGSRGREKFAVVFVTVVELKG
jgi:hypothetical protein